MPRGIQPRIAPTQTYGVVGTSVYGDIVNGATQLMGIVNQGARDKNDAEFRQQGMDFQRERAGVADRQHEEQFQFQQERDRKTDTFREDQQQFQQEQFEQDKQNRHFDNVIKWAESGRTFPGTDPATGEQASGAVAQTGQNLGRSIQSVNAMQGYLDAMGVANTPEAKQTALDAFVPKIAATLDPGADSNPNFEMKGTQGENGVYLQVDEQTYETMPESMKTAFSVIGAPFSEDPSDPGASIEVTPDMMASQLGQEINGMNDLGARGQVVGERKLAAFNKSPYTSKAAMAQKVAGTKRTSESAALRNVMTANQRIDTSRKNLMAQPGADPVAANAAGVESTGLINAAYSTYQTAIERADTEEKVAAAGRALNNEVVGINANFASLAGQEAQFASFKTGVISGVEDGAFNNTQYAASDKSFLGIGEWKKTKKQAKAATEELTGVLLGQLSEEAMAPFIEAEVKALMSANSSLKEGDARNTAKSNFDQRTMNYEQDMVAASTSGAPINSRSLDFLSTYAPRMLRTLRLSNVSSYLAESEVDSQQADIDSLNL
jgi:hypothetical protein